MIKKIKKTVKKQKVLKVQIEEPKIEIAPDTYKQDPVSVEPVLLPSDPTPEPVFNPNEPEMVGIDTGFKRPSITNTKPAYTKKQFKVLIENWLKENESLKESNPAKYEAKKSELETKLAKIKD